MAYVDLDVDLGMFETSDIIEEIEYRGYRVIKKEDYWTLSDEDDIMVLNEIYRLIRTEGDYKSIMEEFILSKLGKVI